MHETKPRCGWVGSDPLYIAYHDTEWCVPEHDDRKLFELLTLEAFQAGLSWITILKKRDAFTQAFDDWDIAKIAKYQTRDVSRLLQNAGIIRNRSKIESTIGNAKAFLKLRNREGSFDSWLWSYAGGMVIRPSRRLKDWRKMPAKTALSTRISKDLKSQGFRFVGPTIIYSFMQAAGMVDDHTLDCWKAFDYKGD